MLDLILWYAWMQVFAFGGWLIASRWLRRLPDGGYGLSKALGLLLGGFLYWWLVTLGLSANNAGAVLMALALLLAAGLALRFLLPTPHSSLLLPRPPLAALVATELIFALTFLGWAAFRSFSPEITEAGGEKFMEIMMVNAILRSPSFPPNDAWLSGFSISYYYFGYIILAMLVRISGVAPAIGFNLGNATFFALTLTGAFSLGYNLWALRLPASRLNRFSSRAPLAAGLVTAVMLGVMGNLGGLAETARCARILPQEFWNWLDVRQIEDRPVECTGLAPTRFYWWWDWSRVIHDYTPAGNDQEAITEMPVFSFILGDNHPHVMGLPFVLVAISVALHLFTARDTDGKLKRWIELLLGAIVIGGLSFMNTWDFPVYGALAIGGWLLGRWLHREPFIPGIVFAVALVALAYLLYLPFYTHFASQAAGIGINLFNGTRWIQFVLMFAPFVAAGAAFLWVTTRQIRHATSWPLRILLGRAMLVMLGALVMSLSFLVVIAAVSPEVRSAITEVANGGNVMGVTRQAAEQRLLARLSDPWVPLAALFAAALCAVLIIAFRPKSSPNPAAVSVASPVFHSPTPFILLLYLGGALLTAAVEFVFLRDMFGTRMNTIFKFYYQGWTVWAVASGFALMTLWSIQGIASRLAAASVSLLVACGLLYPLFAMPSKASAYSGQPTLDGAIYVRTTRPDDAQAIDWLNQTVAGTPVIAEAPTDRYGAYQYTGRISAFTGLPALLGWSGHQNQWRGNYDEPARREPLIEALFSTADDATAQRILGEFGVQYVVIGRPERDRYPAEGLAKFDRLGAPVFRAGDTVVYRIHRSPSSP